MKASDGTAALIKLQVWERLSLFRKGNFDGAGFFLRLVLVGALAAIFAVFFAKFCEVYLLVKSSGEENRPERLYEILTIAYFLIALSSALGSAGGLRRELFAKDNLKLFPAMPIRSRAIYFSGLLTVYAGQVLFALATILPVNLAAARFMPQTAGFYGATAVLCLILPLLTVLIGSVFSLPFHALLQFFKRRYFLTFLIVTGIAAAGFWLYAQLLTGVKELLLGDDLKYFFDERKIAAISSAAKVLYPANFFADLVLRKNVFRAGIGLFGIASASLLISLIFVKGTVIRALQASGREPVFRGHGRIAKRRSELFTLAIKELKEIFRAPGYAFSCFSTAAIMPLMVYFCMSVGSSLVKRLVGLECNAELAFLLTLLFGSLCNVFCSTNISREGENFYILKALPLSPFQIFGSKLIFCSLISVLAQGLSAAAVYFSGYVSVGIAIFLFLSGSVSSFAQICFATRYDFARARFSSEEEGTAGEAAGTASAVILLGTATSLLLGGSALAAKLISALRLKSAGLGILPFLISGGIILVLAIMAYLYLARRLKKRYYEFSGGGIL